MSKNYPDITATIAANLSELRKQAPGLMQGFADLAKSATADSALPAKTKELIALALGVAGHCDGCIGFHTKALIRQGVTKEEFIEVLGVAVYMGGGPSLMYAAEALEAFEQFSRQQ